MRQRLDGLGQPVPQDLEGRLTALDAEGLRALFSRLVRVADAAELGRLLAG